AALGGGGGGRLEELRLCPEVPDGHAVGTNAEPGQVRRMSRGVDEDEVGRRERRAVERGERPRPEPRRAEHPPVLDQRLAKRHERREDERGPRPAQPAGKQRVELPAEADHDQRRRTRERTPAPGEPACRGCVAGGEACKRQRPEVAPGLVARLLPDRLVTLDEREARPGKALAQQAGGAVRADVRAEQARGHRWLRRTSSRWGASPASRTTSGPLPRRSSISRTRKSVSSSSQRLLPIRSATRPMEIVWKPTMKST